MYRCRPIILPSVAVVAVLGLLATGCGGGSPPAAASVAASAAATTAASATQHAAQPSALAFAQCMRGHGIADFPDPDSSGTINLKALHPGPGNDLDPSNPRFEAAQKACKPLEPTAFSPGSHPVTAAGRQQALAFSKCMREHKVANFPDPGSNGRLSVQSIRAAGIRATSPQFQTALKACEQYQPGIHFPGGGA